MNEEEVLTKIEQLRSELSTLVKEKGYTHNGTIQISQQLDYYLNYYNELQQIQKEDEQMDE